MDSNTKNCPVLDVKVYFHQGRYCIKVVSVFRDKTVSRVRVVNGINKYVTETSEEILVERIELVRTGKPLAKAQPRPKPAVIVSYFFPNHERK